ncbi:hypothetical protein [Methylosinus sp. PW1]|uniref:hypothetical protein n=1 Tax=Methylosinus sp. PW1 TaxID=107636 RepID=UPI000566DB7F|nr:hypothetical protein [Methylosinus sp. PW1]
MTEERKVVALRGGRQDTAGEVVIFLQDLLKRARNGEIIGLVAGVVSGDDETVSFECGYAADGCSLADLVVAAKMAGDDVFSDIADA